MFIELLCALLGRTLLPLNRLDRWQVLPFLVGIGGTGKSLLLTVLQHLFAHGRVGNLGCRREEVFGLANLVDKDVVIGRDLPHKTSRNNKKRCCLSYVAAAPHKNPGHATTTQSAVAAPTE